MEDCIFCKITKGKIDSVKVWEDDEFLAILDIQPIVEGMTVVLPKKHYGPNVFEMPEDAYQKFLIAVKRVANQLQKKLDAKKVFMVMEGLDVNHAHIKLYPTRGGKALSKILDENFPAPIKALQELKRLAEKLKISST